MTDPRDKLEASLNAKPLFLDHLEDTARKATPGKWDKAGDNRHVYSFWDNHLIEIARLTGNGKRPANAEYIAAANPQAILDLIARLRKQNETMAFIRSNAAVESAIWTAAKESMDEFDALNKKGPDHDR